MAVPYTFQSATGSIPLSQLDSNFATAITIGNTAVVLGDTITTMNNLILGNVSITSVANAFPNGYLANSNVIVGTTTLTLGSTVTSINGLSLSNVTISSGNVTISNVTTTNVTATTANVTTANVGTLTVIGNETVGGNVSVTGNVSMNVATITTANVSGTANISSLVVTGNQTLTGGTANGVAYLNTSKVMTTGTGFVFDGTNVGIGTSSPAEKFHVNTPSTGGIRVTNTTTGSTSSDGVWLGIDSSGQAYLYNYENTATAFYTNNTERMRIDSSGNVLVAKTATSTTTAGAEIRSADGSFYSTNSATTNTTSTYNAYSTGASAYRFYVGMAGTVFATNTTITAISDVRLKENIRDLDEGLDVVMALKPRKFDWKEGKGADTKNARGFIAQEFEQVLPDMIEEWKDPAPEGEEPYKAINANLIPTLVKAIQEQQALITALTARIEALENK